MPKHTYLSNQYIASTIADYCRHPVRLSKGFHNLRNVEQHGENIFFDVGKVTCKIQIIGMIKENPQHYFSKYELFVKDSEIEPEKKNLALNVKRTKNGRISGEHFDTYQDYINDICTHSDKYHKKLESILNSK